MPETATGIPAAAGGGSPQAPRLVTPQLLRDWPLPEPTGSKYSRGQVLVVGGAATTPGAAILAGTSALRMGAGRLTLAVARSIAPYVAVAVPECGTVPLPDDEAGSVTGEGAAELLETELSRADAVLIGPGLDDPEGSARLVSRVLPLVPAEVTVVLDAFGLTVLPEVADRHVEPLHGRLICTPNTGELARLVGADDLDDDAVLESAGEVARRYGAVVACDSWVCDSERVWQITTGDTGLGTSGSGDVVAGAAAGLASRGAGTTQALIWAKHVHAAAGDDLAARYGRVGFLAGELVHQLPVVLRSLRGD